MPLLTLHNAHLAFGFNSLLENESFSLEAHERVGLIGRNGQGKSSLLKILAQTQTLDSGSLQVQAGVRVAYLAQEPLFDAAETVFDTVAHGLADVRQAVQRYTELTEAALDAQTLEKLHSMIEANDGWSWQQRVEQVLSQLDLPAEKNLAKLSGGWKKRVALAQALVQKPEVLLLDEPTNHLDLEAIVWLGQFLTDFAGSIVVVSHDRAFLDKVSTHIIELDRGKLSRYNGNLSYYLRHKEEELAQETLANARADKLLSQEEIWVRQGVEGRRTRSVARIARLEQLRQERQARRDRLQNPLLTLDAGKKSGKLVAELDKLGFNYPSTKANTNININTNTDASDNATTATAQSTDTGETTGDTLIKQFSAIFLRGDKVAIVGPNGCGKTTLLKLILGQLQPSSGKARQGSKLQIAYFDQMRTTLDESASLEDFISPGSEWVEIAGKRKHVKSYLSDFLFPPERAHAPVSTLSGGERNRLLLARLFALPANILVLDEPTNDLDLETIDLLESLLQTYQGTIFLVSHDRSFLNNVVTSTIAYEGRGRWCEYAGGVDDYLLQRARSAKFEATNSKKAAASLHSKPKDFNTELAATTATPKRKLSYKEQRALEQIPQQIEDLEKEQAELRQRFLDPTLYSQDPAAAQALHQRDADIEVQLQTLLERWED